MNQSEKQAQAAKILQEALENSGKTVRLLAAVAEFNAGSKNAIPARNALSAAKIAHLSIMVEVAQSQGKMPDMTELTKEVERLVEAGVAGAKGWNVPKPAARVETGEPVPALVKVKTRDTLLGIVEAQPDLKAAAHKAIQESQACGKPGLVSDRSASMAAALAAGTINGLAGVDRLPAGKTLQLPTADALRQVVDAACSGNIAPKGQFTYAGIAELPLGELARQSQIAPHVRAARQATAGK